MTILFTLFSCSKDDDLQKFTNSKYKLPTKINAVFLLNDFYNHPEILVYNESKQFIERKNAAYISSVPGASIGSGLGVLDHVFTDRFSQKLIYSKNLVEVQNYIYNQIKYPTIYYYLHNDGTINYKEKIYGSPNHPNDVKELYVYSNDKLSEIKTSFPNLLSYLETLTSGIDTLSYVQYFHYDINDNLIKTELYEQHNSRNEGTKIIYTFEDYDNSYNPFKKLLYIEEYFYRSVSKNNFRKYTKAVIDEKGMLIENQEKSWNPTYDSKGNIILYVEK